MRLLRIFGIWVAATIALALLFLSAKHFYDAHDLKRRYLATLEARALDIEVDLSKTGHYAAPLEEKNLVYYKGQYLELRLPPEVLAEADVAELLAGLRLRVEVIDSTTGELVERREFEVNQPSVNWDGGIPLVLLIWPSSDREGYGVDVNVLQGAPALEGIPQRLTVRYEVSGVGIVGHRIVGGLQLFGSIVAGCVALGLLRWRPAPAPR